MSLPGSLTRVSEPWQFHKEESFFSIFTDFSLYFTIFAQKSKLFLAIYKNLLIFCTNNAII